MEMWCPDCAGRVESTAGLVNGAADTFVACTRCPWVSQVDDDGALVDDERDINIEDLRACAPVEGVALGLSALMHGADFPSLRGRKES